MPFEALRKCTVKHSVKSYVVLICALAALGGASRRAGAQVVDTVPSDDWGNTAMGAEALESDTAGDMTGSGNTAAGVLALATNSSGNGNTAFGNSALSANSTANNNTAIGNTALGTNTTGTQNTAAGTNALADNQTGSNDTATGYTALYGNTTGANNTAAGSAALYFNTTGSRNNAYGEGALQANTTASDNNAMGASALHDNTTGTLNNAMGNFAMEFNTTGSNNNAVGYGSLLQNTTGSDNSGQGYFSLEHNTTGNLNIGVGYKAGVNLTTGSNNIDIGNEGLAAESNIIRIGTQGTQSATFIAAISGTNISGGAAVMVSSTGQLGVVSSSRRYKEDIQPMGDVSERLYQLRPVTFRYQQSNSDGRKPIQVGLIAEDVAETMPELAIYNAAGQPESVAYHLLPTLLLNELQKQHEVISVQAQQLATEQDHVNTLTRQLAAQDQKIAELAAQTTEMQSLKTRLADLEQLASRLVAGNVEPGKTEPVALIAAAK